MFSLLKHRIGRTHRGRGMAIIDLARGLEVDNRSSVLMVDNGNRLMLQFSDGHSFVAYAASQNE